MALVNKPIKNLTKQEFDDAYNEMSLKFDKENRNYMQKESLLRLLVQLGEITLSKALELKG